jgi:hypothetical protein
MKLCRRTQAFKLIELMFTIGLTGVLGLLVYSILNTGTVLGAKNTAMNTAHEQARIAMVEMIQDLHSSISQPSLVNVNGQGQAQGIAFQKWGYDTVNGKANGGPHKIIPPDPTPGQSSILISVTSGQSAPTVGQRLVVPTHQIEADITAVSGNSSNLNVTLDNFSVKANTPGCYKLPDGSWALHNLPVAISGTGSSVGDVVCYITDRCSYTVTNSTLNWNWKGTAKTLGNDITNSMGVLYDPTHPTDTTNFPPTPFSIPTTVAGAPYTRFVAAIDLSTADFKYSNRGYKSANILLNGRVPYKARLTTYQ